MFYFKNLSTFYIFHRLLKYIKIISHVTINLINQFLNIIQVIHKHK